MKTELHPYFMARIVDVEAFFKEYEWNLKENEKIVFHVEDEEASWNKGYFTITDMGIGQRPILVIMKMFHCQSILYQP